jgi:thioredoxin reductase
MSVYDSIIVGGGPAGLSAAIHLAWHDRAVLVIDRKTGPLFFTGKIKKLCGRKGILSALVLQDDTELQAEAFFFSTPAHGRTDLAQQLGVDMAANGNHAQPKTQRGDTNIPGVWIAGDLRPMTQQVAVAMGTGNIAAIMIDQYLRKKDSR